MILKNRREKLKFNRIFKKKSKGKEPINKHLNEEVYEALMDKIKKKSPLTFLDFANLCAFYDIDYTAVISIDNTYYTTMKSNEITPWKNQDEKVSLAFPLNDHYTKYDINPCKLNIKIF